ncbi:MAG: hypothetical protein KUG78_02635 [Kangiellaceae bacterium]|nr:hypothetical protein [Kangiellaceae bacterium]
MNLVVRIIVLTLLIGVTSGCGFHLRGQSDGKSLTSGKGLTVYLAVNSDDKLLRRQITNDLQASDLLVVSEPELSGNHLVVVSAKVNKRAIGVDSNGRNNEFELNQNVQFIVNAFASETGAKKIQKVESLLEPIEVQARRSFYLDNIDLIGKRAEEKGLLESIRQEVSRKIISRFVVTLDQQLKTGKNL